MTIQVEISVETMAKLAAKAQACGIPPETYAGNVLHEVLASPARGTGQLTVKEFHAMLDALAEGSEKLPNLQVESFTRESFH
ncbi:MAG TPA: hypothetical protein VGG97_11305 [Bryobacteraceae bacterium]|jgi:hypothetical protein